MALKKTVVLDSGLVVENAYLVVKNVSGDKTKLTFSIVTFLNKTAHDSRKTALASKLYEFIPSNDENALRWDKQAYNYAKTLSEYVNAIDC